MPKALKSFRHGTEMIRRGASLDHLPAPVVRDLASRGLGERPEQKAAAKAGKPAAKAAKPRRDQPDE
ncbi:hypothetical protein SAMN04515666_11928 [Bosea lupini]|uniref:Uncharacterized protein n=1 Tax=Bosea lupini TaxID=1036779 RepID=A0A1H8AF27_9HYPH|nr:hypothetical protein [Bosea lupini]SEM69086.1 hypothetical protein SAMN04515666_11928 [Bosea lupini]